MALDNTAVLKVGVGHFYTAPIDTALPVDLLDPEAGGTGPWEEMGHTSLEDILNAASEGGDATTLGTLQAPTLRQTFSARTETYTMNLLQFDTPSLKLYYGGNSEVTAEGHVNIPTAPVPSELAWLFIFTDGDSVGGLYAPKVSIFRSDDFAISDTESLSQLPLAITPLVSGTNNWATKFLPPAVPPVAP